MTAKSTEAVASERSTGQSLVETNSLGYEYVRCRAGADDETCYVHQLLACLDVDPSLVFAEHTFVMRHVPVPWLNVPENLTVALKHQMNKQERKPPEDVLIGPLPEPDGASDEEVRDAVREAEEESNRVASDL
jgi:hypothetical protein